MPEFDEPIDDYAAFFKDEHARNVTEHFEELVRSSGVDEQLNIQTMTELRALQQNVSASSSSRGWWKAGRIIAIIVAVALCAIAIYMQSIYFLAIAPAIALIVLIFKKINPEISSLNEKVAEFEKLRDEKSNEAWVQMEPLNDLYSWDTPAKLFMKTFPLISLDGYFSSERLKDLSENYGLSPAFNDGRSVFVTQSGAFKDNPFVIARYKEHWMGSKTYVGSIVIQWVESVRNADGNWVNVQRTQTLTASVVKPFPEYQVRSTIIYGHEIAPNLSFSRTPSNLSGLEDGFMNNRRKESAIKKVEKKARKDIKTGSGELTVMSNKEFEALFNAIDRDHEVEFRLLFTPLAQQEMVKLLNDKNIGFGDDFTFNKQGMVNFVEPNHLANVELDGNPHQFKSQELAAARAFFNDFHNKYFKSMYFAFAPLWTIPMYREKRTMSLRSEKSWDSSFWEHEGIANAIGQENFRHPESVTENILKTSASGSGATKNVTVTAHGYEGIPRTDIIPMLGGDGNMHPVPVHWIQYIAVSQDTTMVVGAVTNNVHNNDSDDEELTKGWQSMMSKNGITPEEVVFRGALAAALLR
jgi:hypothetical protein